MALIVAINLIVVGSLVTIVFTKGFEQALPFFAFVVTLMPGESSIPLAGLFDLTTTRLAIMTLAILYVVEGQRDVNVADKGTTPLKYVLLLLFAWNLISAMNSVVVGISLKTVLSNLFDFYVVYYIVTRTVSEVRTVRSVLVAIVAALTVCCVFGWFEAYFNWKAIDLFPAVAHRFTPGEDGLMAASDRIRSTFPHAILFANGLALGIPMALYLLTLATSGLQRVVLWISVLLMFWNVYKTMSRGPWLALVMSLLLLLVMSQSSIRWNVAAIFGLTLLVLVIRPGVWETLKNTYFETVDPDSARGESYEYRYTLMRVGREALAKDLRRAAWGFGPESFSYLGFEGEDPDTGHAVKFDSCDSALVEMAVDTGYVGLALVMILMGNATFASWKTFTHLPAPENALGLVLFVNLAAYVLMMTSVMNFGWGQQSYMLWIVMALSMVYGDLSRGEATVARSGALTQSPGYCRESSSGHGLATI